MASAKINSTKVTYDFAKKGGAVSAITLPLALPTGAVLTRAFVKTVTPPTSGGSATIALAVGGIALKAATAYNAAPFVGGGDCGITSGTLTSAATALTLTIAVAALTAGVLDIIVEYVD